MVTASLLNFVSALVFEPLLAPLFADDDCVAGNPTPAFSPKLSQLRNYKMNQEKKQNLITETFQFKDGTAVLVSQGGCVHFDRTVTFTVKSSTRESQKFNSKLFISQANELLSKLPIPNSISKQLQFELKKQKEELLKQNPIIQGNKYELEATDPEGYETVRLEMLKKGSTVDISVSLNTAL